VVLGIGFVFSFREVGSGERGAYSVEPPWGRREAGGLGPDVHRDLGFASI